MLSLLSKHSEFLVLAASCAAAFAIQGVWLRKVRRAKLPRLVWILAAVLLAAAWQLSGEAGTREQQRIERETGDFARLYADEMQRRGHSRLASDAAADDPLYLDLIETEKRWLALNPSVNDIYTLRKLPDGRNAFLADSETDYNHDGKYEGEREERTDIGEVYEEADAAMERAFQGEANFGFERVTERWGIWISAFVPLYAPDGRVEGILGVDFDAGNFAHIIAGAKWRVIGLMALVQTILLGFSTVTTLLHAEAGDRKCGISALRESEERFRQMAENINQVFWMARPDGRELFYVSPAYEQIWARTCASACADPQSRLDAIVPEDRPAVFAALERTAHGGMFDIEYRITWPDGSQHWISDHGFAVRDDMGEIVRVCGIAGDITARKWAEEKLSQVHRELLDTSRRAGMAEVATSVLHNVGNVLNSVNTSIIVATEKVAQLKVEGLGRTAELLNEHAGNLPAFFAEHPQGVRLPKFLAQLAGHFAAEQKTVLGELKSLGGHLEHINEIVAMQQSYAGAGGVIEQLPLADVIHDALRINAAAFERHQTHVACEIDPAIPPVTINRNKLLLILVNLVRNAKYACDDAGNADKRITVRTHLNGDGLAKISVSDNGIGIPPENLTRIFAHGFTTRKGGHGFGLHSSALAASEMGGALRAKSDGPGRGATFTIELPVNPSNS